MDEFKKIVGKSTDKLKVDVQSQYGKLWIETPYNTYTIEKFPSKKFRVSDLGYSRYETVNSMFEAIVKLNNFIAYDLHNINLVKKDNENLHLNFTV